MLPLALALGAVTLTGCSKGPSVSAPLDGKWNGPNAVIVAAPCPSSSKFCVTLASGKDASMAALAGTVIVRDLAPDGPGLWQGRFIGEGKNLTATFRLSDVNNGEFRVCLFSWLPFGLCEAQQYNRILP